MSQPTSPKDRYSRHTLKLFEDDRDIHIFKFLSTLQQQSLFEFSLSRLHPHDYDIHHLGGYFYHHIKDFHMAKRPEWAFVEIKLSKDDKPALDKFIDSYKGDMFDVVEDLTELGYKVSISYVDKQNSYVVSVSGSERSGLNNYQTITSWSSVAQEAVAMAGYKVLVIAKDSDWADFATESSNWG